MPWAIPLWLALVEFLGLSIKYIAWQARQGRSNDVDDNGDSDHIDANDENNNTGGDTTAITMGQKKCDGHVG